MQLSMAHNFFANRRQILLRLCLYHANVGASRLCTVNFKTRSVTFLWIRGARMTLRSPAKNIWLWYTFSSLLTIAFPVLTICTDKFAWCVYEGLPLDEGLVEFGKNLLVYNIKVATAEALASLAGVEFFTLFSRTDEDKCVEKRISGGVRGVAKWRGWVNYE